MARSLNRCPQCGEPVSQFAAGCAICGADLEAHRKELAEKRRSLPRVEIPGADRLSAGRDEHVLRLALAIAVALFAPLFGLILAAWFAYLADQHGRDGIRNALIAVCGFAFAMLYFAPFSVWGLLL